MTSRSADNRFDFRKRCIEAIAASFSEWVQQLDSSRRKTTTTIASFCGIAFMGLAGMALAGLVPGTRDFFSLRFIPATICFIPTLLLGFLMGYLEKHNRISLYTFGWMSLTGSGLFQFYMWSLVAFSNLPGATVMAAFPILLASFHGQLYHSTLRHPFVFIVSAGAAVCGFLLNTDPAHCAIAAIAVPMALCTHLLLGAYARNDFKTRREQIALREAVDAQILEDRTRTVEQITVVLDELRGYNHDAGNALSGLSLMIPQFASIVRSGEMTHESLREAGTIAESLLQNLNRLQELLLEARQVSAGKRPDAAQVTPYTEIKVVADALSHLYPKVTIVCNASPALKQETVPFFGGSLSFRRVLHNLVLNACQGNGKEAGSNVKIDLAHGAPRNQFLVTIIDNGPGFSPEQVAAPVTGFVTTKESGSGLGLYSVERMLKANGGSLLRSNLKDAHGACVVVCLRTEIPPS